MKMKNLSCQNFKLVWWIVLVSDKLIIKSLHAMCVLSSWEKTKFVPKNGKSGQTEREAGQQKMMKYLVSWTFSNSKSIIWKSKLYFFKREHRIAIVQIVKLCPKISKLSNMSKNVQILQILSTMKKKLINSRSSGFQDFNLVLKLIFWTWCMTIFMNISWVLKNTNFKTKFQVIDKLKSYAS